MRGAHFLLFFSDPPPTEIHALSLHDALPIFHSCRRFAAFLGRSPATATADDVRRFQLSPWRDRKSTRLNSSHSQISYAVFCLKKKTGRWESTTVCAPTQSAPQNAASRASVVA